MSEILPGREFSFPDFTQKCVNYTNFKNATKQRNFSVITLYTALTYLNSALPRLRNLTQAGQLYPGWETIRDNFFFNICVEKAIPSSNAPRIINNKIIVNFFSILDPIIMAALIPAFRDRQPSNHVISQPFCADPYLQHPGRGAVAGGELLPPPQARPHHGRVHTVKWLLLSSI